MIDSMTVINWIGVVFAAGFVGYFGRYLSMRVIQRIQKHPKKTAVVVKSISKKQLKAELKHAKKTKKFEKSK
jgi:3-polyprenyl-4-hydroxybenzoate decarboxylase